MRITYLRGRFERETNSFQATLSLTWIWSPGDQKPVTEMGVSRELKISRLASSYCSIMRRPFFLEATLVKGLVVGVLLGALLLMGGIYYYFASGMAPVAAADPPMPYEKKMASMSKNAHIRKQPMPPPAVPADEPNFVAGAKVYKEQCANCHGLPDQKTPAIADAMYPHAPLLFKGKGVTDDPPSETHWTVSNGIRLSGMPGFKDTLSDTQLWQVAQLLAHADQLPDSAKKVLVPDPLMVGQAAPIATPITSPGSKKK